MWGDEQKGVASRQAKQTKEIGGEISFGKRNNSRDILKLILPQSFRCWMVPQLPMTQPKVDNGDEWKRRKKNPMTFNCRKGTQKEKKDEGKEKTISLSFVQYPILPQPFFIQLFERK